MKKLSVKQLKNKIKKCEAQIEEDRFQINFYYEELTQKSHLSKIVGVVVGTLVFAGFMVFTSIKSRRLH